MKWMPELQLDVRASRPISGRAPLQRRRVHQSISHTLASATTQHDTAATALIYSTRNETLPDSAPPPTSLRSLGRPSRGPRTMVKGVLKPRAQGRGKPKAAQKQQRNQLATVEAPSSEEFDDFGRALDDAAVHRKVRGRTLACRRDGAVAGFAERPQTGDLSFQSAFQCSIH